MNKEVIKRRSGGILNVFLVFVSASTLAIAQECVEEEVNFFGFVKFGDVVALQPEEGGTLLHLRNVLPTKVSGWNKSWTPFRRRPFPAGQGVPGARFP